jgi:glycosyltransferase involved in cell wall biosynthesis
MRVLHVISSIDSASGGPSAALRGLAKAQRQGGMDATVLATWHRPESMAEGDLWRRDGVPVGLVGPAHGPLQRHRDLAAAVARAVAGVQVVHIHALWEEIQHLAARAAWRAGIPYVIRPCGMLSPWSLRQSRWKKRLYMAWRMRRHLDRAAAIHYTTTSERLDAAGLKLRGEAIVEPIGTDIPDIAELPPAGEFRARDPRFARGRLILFLGRVHQGKGVEMLIPALACMARRDVCLAVVGPDSRGYLAEMQRLADRHGVADRVVFTGMLTGRDKLAALVDADLLSLPSEHENQGMAVVEALAAGTPVVVSDQVGIHHEILAGGVGGVVPLDVEALAAELTRWLDDEALRTAAGANGRAFAQQHFGWPAIAARWRGHYERLLATTL